MRAVAAGRSPTEAKHLEKQPAPFGGHKTMTPWACARISEASECIQQDY